jgi:hypothetical protein
MKEIKNFQTKLKLITSSCIKFTSILFYDPWHGFSVVHLNSKNSLIPKGLVFYTPCTVYQNNQYS